MSLEPALCYSSTLCWLEWIHDVGRKFTFSKTFCGLPFPCNGRLMETGWRLGVPRSRRKFLVLTGNGRRARGEDVREFRLWWFLLSLLFVNSRCLRRDIYCKKSIMALSTKELHTLLGWVVFLLISDDYCSLHCLHVLRRWGYAHHDYLPLKFALFSYHWIVTRPIS